MREIKRVHNGCCFEKGNIVRYKKKMSQGMGKDYSDK